MNCKRVLELYDMYRQEQLSDKQMLRLEEHLAHCPKCRQEYEANEALAALLMEYVEPPAANPLQNQMLANRTLEALRRPAPRLAWLREAVLNTRHGAAALKRRYGQAAAAVCLALTAGFLFARMGAHGGSHDVRYVPAIASAKDVNNPQSRTNFPVATPEEIESFEYTELALRDGVSDGSSKMLVGKSMSYEEAQQGNAELLSMNPVAEYDPFSTDAPPWVGEPYGAIAPANEAQKRASGYYVISAEALEPLVDRLSEALDEYDYKALFRGKGSESSPIAVSSSGTEANIIEATLQSLLRLKWDLRQNGELQEYQTAIRELENRLCEAQVGVEDRKALKLYFSAEDDLLSGRQQEALQKYARIADGRQGTMLAALSHFNMGNIQFELTDFEAACREYWTCLRDYKQHFSDDRQAMIQTRLQRIDENREFGFEPLRLYLTAQQTSDEDAFENYTELLRKYPTNAIASNAIEALRRMALEPKPTVHSADWIHPVLRELELFRKNNPRLPAAVNAQLAYGDIVMHRLHNFNQARLEYGRVFDMTQDTAALSTARERLKTLSELETLSR
ncbi:zf-HC2 domain-containing protein [Candidatus Sumerlaeota bacterium]|nr:zf-HC2 domain-containing protein [Candidatus Sumerlaeota bacterium]